MSIYCDMLYINMCIRRCFFFNHVASLLNIVSFLWAMLWERVMPLKKQDLVKSQSFTFNLTVNKEVEK